MQSGKEVIRFIGHSAEVCTVVFSPDGKYILTASFDNTARLWPIPPIATSPQGLPSTGMGSTGVSTNLVNPIVIIVVFAAFAVLLVGVLLLGEVLHARHFRLLDTLLTSV